MSVANGQVADQTTFNSSFMSREVDDNTIGKKDFQNTDPSSGGDIINIQQVINSIASALGMSTGEAYDFLISWAADFVGAPNDTVKARVDALVAEFEGTTGHSHNGSDGEGVRISAAELVDINYLKSIYQSATIASASGTSIDVSSSFTTKTPGGTSTQAGVATTAPNNRVYVMDSLTETFIEDVGGQRVYGKLTYSAGVWTLAFYTNEAGTETAHNLASTNITIFFQEVFTLATLPTFSPSPAEFGTLDVTADVADATATIAGKVNTTTQTFGGAKTFANTTDSTNKDTGAIITEGGIGAEKNISSGATVQAVLSFLANLGGLDATANDKGLEVKRTTTNGQVFYDSALTSKWKLGDAGSLSEVIVAALAQTLSGDKTFSGLFSAQGTVRYGLATDSTTTGANQSISPSKVIHVLKNASLVSINNIADPAQGKKHIIVNKTGSTINLINNAGGTADHRIETGSGADLPMSDGSTVLVVYNDDASLWSVIGGAQGGSPTFPAEDANEFLAGPVSGAAATPVFRKIDYRDLPQSGNLLLNADGTISERGTYTTATAMNTLLDSTNFYFADRHRGFTTGLTTSQVTVQRNSASLPTGFNDGFSLKVAATATNASARIGWQQPIERPEYLRNKTLTFKSYVRSNSANARLAISATVGSSGYSSAHSGGGAWEELTATITVDSAETGLIPMARLMTSANANVSITSGDFVEVFMPTVYVGDIFPGYVNMFNGNVSAERLACRRFFQKISSRYYLPQVVLATNEVDWFWVFETEMRNTPTVRFEGTANTDYAAISAAGGTQAGFSFTTAEASVRGVNIVGTKVAHGLTYSAFRIINSAGVVSADAEL